MQNSTRILIIAIGLVIGFLLYQYLLPTQTNLHLIGYPNGSTIRTGDRDLFYFKNQRDAFDVTNFFNRDKTDLFSLKTGEQKSLNTTQYQRLSEHIVKANFNDTVILFFTGELTDNDLLQAHTQPISFRSEFWVIDRHLPPIGSFPLPKTAVLKVGDTKLNKTQKNFSRENQVPIVGGKESPHWEVVCEESCTLNVR